MRGANADGDRLRSARVFRGLTQEHLANLAEVDVKTVRKAERGGRLDVATLAKIADALGIGLGRLIDGEAEDVTAAARHVVVLWVAAWDAQDSEALLMLYHPDAVMYLPGGSDIPYGGTFAGRDAVRQAHETAWATTRTIPMEPEDYRLVASGGNVVLQGRKGICIPDGRVVSFWCVQSFLVDGGLIIEHRVEFDTLTYAKLTAESSAGVCAGEGRGSSR